jgi:prepilin-type N-terminal cleavage/methylation domain-containing protein
MGKNEKGVTLVELLAAMMILSVILLSIVQFFPQIGRMNQHNDVKTKGLNLAKEVLVQWTHSEKVISFLDNPDDAPPPSGYQTTDEDHHVFKTKVNGFDVLIKINKHSNLKSTPSEAHFIFIELIDHEGKQVSEIYGYVMVDGTGAE